MGILQSVWSTHRYRSCAKRASVRRSASRMAHVQLVEILSLLNTTSRIPMHVCAEKLGLSADTLGCWIDILQRRGVVYIERIEPGTRAYRWYCSRYSVLGDNGHAITMIIKSDTVACIASTMV